MLLEKVLLPFVIRRPTWRLSVVYHCVQHSQQTDTLSTVWFKHHLHFKSQDCHLTDNHLYNIKSNQF